MLGSLDTVPLSQLDGDTEFRLRAEGDVTGLAQSIAREGQLVPIELRLRGPGRWQVLAGFRRIAALKLLQRDMVLARLHDQMSDEAALALAIADGVSERPLGRAELEQLRERLVAEGKYGPEAQEAIERGLGEAPPPPEPEEVDLDVFSREVRDRLAQLAIDVGSLYENWADVERQVREDVRARLRYFRDLLPFLEEDLIPAPAAVADREAAASPSEQSEDEEQAEPDREAAAEPEDPAAESEEEGEETPRVQAAPEGEDL